jgi:FAD:protein FMN transferase
MGDHELDFGSMGTRVRVIAGPRLRAAARHPAAQCERARAWIEYFDRRLSRFRPDSELSALNADPRESVPASALLRRAVSAGLWAADATGGLVDPTLVEEIERAGYSESRAHAVPASLEDALAERPTARPARPDPRRRWRRFTVDEATGTIRRPPGVAFDTGGAGKGLAADMAAAMMTVHSRFVVDCGGDVRIGGPAAALDPYEVEVRHPLGGIAHRLRVSASGVATSGIERNIWRRDGRFAHHLLDPSSGEPAWTGLVSATALASTAVEAEALAKAAFLSGPEQARSLLAPRGGVLIDYSGEVEVLGAARSGQLGPRVIVPGTGEAA